MASEDINDVRKWEQFCARMFERTESKSMSWDDNSEGVHRSDAVSPLFVSRFKGWTILIYRYSYNYYHDEDRFTPAEEVAIEIINEKGKIEWTLPKVPSRSRLIDLIQYQTSDVASLFKEMLSDE